jgi:hypothetical protein
MSPDRFDRVVHTADGSAEPDRELTPDAAGSAPDRSSRYYAGDKLVRYELVRGGKVRTVRYFDRDWPDPDLLAAHQADYGEAPFEVLSAVEPGPGGGKRRRIWSVRPDGQLGEYDDHTLDDDGEILAEERFLPDGTLLARIEYEYGNDGELSLTRELDAEGKVINEWE